MALLLHPPSRTLSSFRLTPLFAVFCAQLRPLPHSSSSCRIIPFVTTVRNSLWKKPSDAAANKRELGSQCSRCFLSTDRSPCIVSPSRLPLDTHAHSFPSTPMSGFRSDHPFPSSSLALILSLSLLRLPQTMKCKSTLAENRRTERCSCPQSAL